MTPIAPLISSFLREHMPIEQGCSPHTCETYAHAFRLLFIFASKRLGIRPSQICLEQIDAALILEFLAHIEEERGNCAATRNGRLAAVKAFIRYVEFRVPSALAQARQIHAIPGKRHDQALVRHLTMEEVRAIALEVNGAYGALAWKNNFLSLIGGRASRMYSIRASPTIDESGYAVECPHFRSGTFKRSRSISSSVSSATSRARSS
jgi:site-specific recombinase XerD